MLTVKCPKCATALKLREAPASGKVKCPKCSNVVPVGAPAAMAPKPAPVAAGRTLDPDDAEFDFGKINAPSASGVAAVSHFPVADRMAVYEGPIPGDPLAATEEEGGDDDEQGAGQVGGQAAKPAKKKNPMVLVGALVGVGLLLIVGIAAVALMGGGGGGGAPDVDVIAAAKATAPEGYQAVGIDGCVVLMPKGYDLEQLKATAEAKAIKSSESGAVFYFAAMNGGIRPLDKDQMTKKAERQLGGDVLGSAETERNGYKGIKGVLSTSIMLPEKMQVEIYHVEERFVILGVGTADATLPPKGAEKSEREIFFKSFKVGPKPSGWLW